MRRFELAWEHGSGSLRTRGPLPKPFVVLWRRIFFRGKGGQC